MKKSKLKDSVNNAFSIIKKSALNFGSNRPMDLAGTTAYFAIFSIVPIIIIIISVFGYLTGEASIRQKLFEELNVLIGSNSTALLKDAIENYQITENSTFGTILGVSFFLVSATTLFSSLQNSINYIWRVQVKSDLKTNIFKLLKDRVLSFGMILSLGFILLVSLILDASIAFLKDFLATYFSPKFIVLAQLTNVVLTLAIITCVFAFIYRFLPDVKVKWSAAWFGAFLTAILFTLGKFLIGLFIGSSNMGAVYGTAGAFIAILIWIFYASLIFYFGVELSNQYSRFYKHNIKPLNFAVPFEINTLKKS
ncbi:membrane protein [Saccharicrinis carchari]|uniref:Membrane protein n=1 Tax=Saccharicrinis carchari TaxID=1168039 RepID=A0A521CFN0_SACCC|nr:YihY/virulence factor BrkB family protein [Saccharicrinis carchari]SMO58253.1 membrane protein [Saccharicrinis carchari]